MQVLLLPDIGTTQVLTWVCKCVLIYAILVLIVAFTISVELIPWTTSKAQLSLCVGPVSCMKGCVGGEGAPSICPGWTFRTKLQTKWFYSLDQQISPIRLSSTKGDGVSSDFPNFLSLELWNHLNNRTAEIFGHFPDVTPMNEMTTTTMSR